MIERHEIENDLLGEIAEHFTVCGDEQSTYAGLVIEYAEQQHGSVMIQGHDRTSGAPFTATAGVHVLLRPTALRPSADEQDHSGGCRGGGPGPQNTGNQ
ncbi:hypothetical protein ACK1X7_36870 [Streptomyces sp. CY1]|uniref:hypothetical protein n=1 Tax=Streptomyces sp. CY1 TaxID=3388313 RepID=UPI0039A210BE